MRAVTRAVIAVSASLAVVGPIGFFWSDSLVPDTYDMAEMGYPDYGGGPAGGHNLYGDQPPAEHYRYGDEPPAESHHYAGISVADLKGPSGTPDVAVTLTTRQSGNRYTVNGTSPGPEIRAVQGQLIQVTLVNESVRDGVTLHWHGVDVPNAEDGVAGITQDAVRPGQTYVYRFVARSAGTYWYHSHQVSHVQVRNGLFGALVILPRPDAERGTVAAVHTYQGKRTINGVPGVSPLTGRLVRVINTDSGPIRVWVSGASFQVVAIDGRDLHEPAVVENKAILVTAGARVDLRLSSSARVDVGGGAAVAAPGSRAAALPRAILDLLSYGTPAPLGFDPARSDRRFRYDIGRRFGFLNGKPGNWWTVNGHLFPNVPMFMASTGDIVRMTIHNGTGEVHPMHLHGHHMVVLSRNGVASTGSPWWTDSLDVLQGDTFEVAFVADNPGIWADHCHNLKHVPEGLVAHLMYTGVRSSFLVGGPARNVPE
ncbi:multicopper oxidase family protein [Actinoplanes regularis]|uniref:Multicopper oxidase with three cupredoxin domains (Includes cell division protein FtsP and spore coat protein CotA) n=1 Tax=Actinoplanes regularis TaxID=52697 RepID=A0A239DC37_9ACTN|nr:multicopper oxidase family protein [Actinoplanes regularis]GIE88747.1 hypothetical protein Are01nite_52270 [Actinoplanes regularis]SNS29632.1 Multicopper oxidase with three cupredoxin domains (includes cell division protein FtsP and spore coat protein CotA) [Actinoplanes regularis]